MLFVAHLHNEGLIVSGAMKIYLAVVRHEQVSMGLGEFLHCTHV